MFVLLKNYSVAYIKKFLIIIFMCLYFIHIFIKLNEKEMNSIVNNIMTLKMRYFIFYKIYTRIVYSFMLLDMMT